MKKYQIAFYKYQNKKYMLTTTEAIKDYYKTGLLNFICYFTYKKDLINVIKNNPNFKDIKDNVNYKTLYLN